MFTAGTIKTFDAETGRGSVMSREGTVARFAGDVSWRLPKNADAVGTPVVYRATSAKGGPIVVELYIERNEPCEGRDWPDAGEVARVICTVEFCHPHQPYRALHHPGMSGSILVRPKRRPRRDLRTGDAVVAEVVRRRAGLFAVRAVRLPKNYADPTAKGLTKADATPGIGRDL